MYLATANAHKAVELGRLLGTAVAPLVGYPAVEETGATFLDNARLKAAAGRAAAPQDAWVLADDSGLAVHVLGGAPGVESARYGGPDLDDAGRVGHLLRELGEAEDRRARFVCVLVALGPDGEELVAEGTLDGTITCAPRGAGGFGYDPVFVPAGDTRTVAELAPEEKDAISHRGRAARALRATLPAS
ncbi:MAG: Nucleoside 5-triphosphatase RdgB (dHAPTP, dITP, XTP-specific) [uncultured Thermoleophilia bacterium]|uniref:dITP/XTP pyrophosphatase n=1 Tax=uncultured Thermoleophilia bacterium TaxID=1497501 RepID=A0A6J4U3N5_9ACTN|nr:MAG: Nucleoside 5-triphosphatase RdgB (dHAPTP, dITP, XTP-specific) [uncultured Thermoleophilia bacterium]